MGRPVLYEQIAGASGPSSPFAKLWLAANLYLEGLKSRYGSLRGSLTGE